ncbi:MAG TPA: hypothetical protein VGL34_15530 [Steroidobacteraceae bacterium]|jgi:quercetin dioxygenase-like cupin family protein
MEDISRREALSFAVAAASVTVAGSATALAQGSALEPAPGQKLPEGVTRKVWSKHDSMLPGYKTVNMTDLIYQPGAKTNNPSMPSDMVCHVPQGELRVKKPDGEFTAKTGDVWTCKKGEAEGIENAGTTVAIMRVISLLPA